MATLETTLRPGAVQRSEPLSGAYFWLVAFFVVFCARPEDWIPGLAGIPLAKITGLLALLAFVLSLAQSKRRLPREIWYLVMLLGLFCLGVPFAYWSGGSYRHTLAFAKLAMIVPVMIFVVSTLARLRRLIFVQSITVALIAVVSVVKGRLGGAGRLKGVLSGIYSNPNDLAFAIVLSFPFCFVFMLRAESNLRKAFWASSLLIMYYTVVITASRAGLLALVVTACVCLWEFGVKGRRRYLLVLAGLAGFVVLVFAGRGIKERFAGMFGDNPDSREAQVAYGSAEERKELLEKSITLTIQHPLLGVGLGNFVPLSGHWKDSHNSYTQMSSEAGLPGLILYLMILSCAFANVRGTKRLAGRDTEQMLLASALHASLVGYLVGSFFAAVAYHFFPYFLVGYTSALLRITSDQGKAPVESRPARYTRRLAKETHERGTNPRTVGYSS